MSQGPYEITDVSVTYVNGLMLIPVEMLEERTETCYFADGFDYSGKVEQTGLIGGDMSHHDIKTTVITLSCAGKGIQEVYFNDDGRYYPFIEGLAAAVGAWRAKYGNL